MKGKRISKVLITLALTGMLCVSGAASVLASATPPALAGDPITTNNPDVPAQAGITKILQMAEGVDTPDIDFDFNVTEKSLNGDTGQVGSVPPITASVSYDGTEAGTTEDGVKQVILETGDILAGVTWTQEGVYEYTISEEATIDPDATDLTTFSDSKAVYELVVYVREHPTNPGAFYVYAVSAYPTTVDEETQEENTKLDPTPGDNGVTDYSEMTFTNNYIKNNGTTSTDPDDIVDEGVLTVSEAIIPLAAIPDTTEEFTHEVVLTKSPLVRDDLATLEYHAYVITIDENAAATAGAMMTIPMTDDGSGNYTGTVTQVLTDRQRLVFVDLPVGTGYEAEVVGNAQYGASVKIDVDGTETTIGGMVVGAGVATGVQTIGDISNGAEFEHELDEVTPTGISLNSLPFVIIMILIVAAVLVFLVVKSRSRRKAK